MHAETATKHHQLERAYDRFSGRWQSTVERLGFDTAYADFITASGLAERYRGQPLRVLDAGCGSGAFSLKLHDALPQAEFDLLDMSSAMLDQARELLWARGATVRCIQSDVEGAALASEHYDVILCAHLLEHVENAGSTLSMLRRSLKQGGTALYSVSKPHWCTAIVRWRWGHRAYRKPEMIELLRSTRHKIEVFDYPKGPPGRLSHGYIATRAISPKQT